MSPYTVLPLLNGLSDHDAQLLTLKDFNLKDLNSQVQDYYIYTTRDINEYSINQEPLTYLKLHLNQPNSKFILKNTTTHEINKIIQSMTPKDSYGYDEISIKMLKLSAPYILSPLTHIFNKILNKGIFPDRLKFSEVRPIYKKGTETDFANYRPISLLPSLSNIIERLMYNRLYQYFDQNQLFAKEQHGFRQNTSTETAAFSLLDTILSFLEKKAIVGGLFLEMQKAFDCVRHYILLDKLSFYGGRW
jgi:hypothetical protein